MKNLVIVTPARSGSVWLTNALTATQNYKPYIPYFVGDSEHTQGSVEDRIYKLVRNRPWVTKIVTDDMIDLNLLKDTGSLFIWLSRSNIPEHFLSMTLARHTGVYVKENDNLNYCTPNTINFTAEDLDFYQNIHECKLRVYEQYKDWWHMELEYETMFNNNPWRMPPDAGGIPKQNTYSSELIWEATELLKTRGII